MSSQQPLRRSARIAAKAAPVVHAVPAVPAPAEQWKSSTLTYPTGKNLEVANTIRDYLKEIEEAHAGVVKKYITTKLFNYILKEGVDLVNTYPKLKEAVIDKAKEIYHICDNEIDCYKNENRSIMLVCDSIIKTFA